MRELHQGAAEDRPAPWVAEAAETVADGNLPAGALGGRKRGGGRGRRLDGGPMSCEGAGGGWPATARKPHNGPPARGCWPHFMQDFAFARALRHASQN